MKTQKFKIDNTRSTIEWVGRKVTGSHNGTIAVKQGELILSNGQLLGGEFVVDTTAIQVLDIADPETNAQFAGHLASDDFFSSHQFPLATLEIISVKGTHVEANLTIKGITNHIDFDADVKVTGDELTASARLVVDRTKYDIKYRSRNFFQNLGDTLIFNDFELSVSLTASVEKEPVSVLL